MELQESTIIWLIRLIFLMFSLLFSFLLWRYLRRDRYIMAEPKPTYQPPKDIDLPEKIIALSVRPKPGHFFDGESLFNLLYKLGFTLSEHQVFDYLLDDNKTVVFSLINSRNKGVFNKDINKSPIDGLVAVIQFPVDGKINQVQYFHLLLSVLEEIRIDTNAVLCNHKGTPLKTEKLFELQSEIEFFEQDYLEIIEKHERK